MPLSAHFSGTVTSCREGLRHVLHCAPLALDMTLAAYILRTIMHVFFFFVRQQPTRVVGGLHSKDCLLYHIVEQSHCRMVMCHPAGSC